MHMRVDEGTVTAEIANSPLQSVLQELAERTGIVFEVRSQENPLVSIYLYHVSLQEAIQRIASNSDTMFFYDQGKMDPERITLVRIFPRTRSIQQPSLVYLGTGNVTKSNEDIETPEQALEVLGKNASIEARENAIELLVDTKSDTAIKDLMNFMFDPTPEIRAAVIEGLAALGAREALPAILKSLKDAHPGVRQSAATAVALLGTAKNLKDLMPLSSDKDASVAAAADIAIRKLSAELKK
jgi:HEAT repeat protein